jgi:hypothetical protein
MIADGKDSRTVKLRNNTVMLGNHHSNLTLEELVPKDTGLTLFVIKSLTLEKRQEKEGGVRMVLRMERKLFREMLTTYIPSAMLMLTTFITITFEFSDAMGALMTIILVMQGIFTSKIETLPPSSDMKMLDIWLIGCFVYPFIEMILRTIIEARKSEKEEQEKAGRQPDALTNVEPAEEGKEEGKGETNMSKTKQPRGQQVSPLVIQVEPDNGENGLPVPSRASPSTGGCCGETTRFWNYLNDEIDTILRVTGDKNLKL